MVDSAVSGRVVKFDEVRGYGFIAPDAGGDDVFLHVNDLQVDKRLVGAGARVIFTIEEGDRGLKAAGVRLASGSAEVVKEPPAQSNRTFDDQDYLDTSEVLTIGEFLTECTEAILESAPSVTGADIVQIRQALARKAKAHGWIDS
ncbi:cold-shock protein [Antrihabitans spumae]|uniref:Cold-shock protein n=1 Tax=Antrihabitans spumae TaxID=3373370 RepID=A0ABW7KN94_9NOCA